MIPARHKKHSSRSVIGYRSGDLRLTLEALQQEIDSTETSIGAEQKLLQEEQRAKSARNQELRTSLQQLLQQERTLRTGSRESNE